MSKRSDDWLDEEEYPDDRDVEDFGDESAVDYDRRTVGRVGNIRQPYWSKTRLLIVLVIALILFSLIIAELMPLLQR